MIVAAAAPDSAGRRRRFAARDSAENLRRLAQALMQAIDPQVRGVKKGFAQRYHEGRYAEVLAAYRDLCCRQAPGPGAVRHPGGQCG